MAIQASFPIWQDERLLHNYDRLDYYVTFNDETIFRGRAFRSPKNVPIELDINRIVGDWLENGIDPEYEGVLKQENAWGQFKVWDQTTGYLLAEYGVMFNWEQEWSGESKVLSEPVNGRMDPRMRLFWSKYNVSETSVVVEGEDIYWFDADDAVAVAWDAGRATVGIRTNYSIREIVAVCPEGVRTLTYGLNWQFEVPVNDDPDNPKTYTVQWYRNGVLLDQTVITVAKAVFQFECEPTETVGAFGGEVDIWFNTDQPLDRISATVSDGTVSRLTNGHLFVSIPQNETGSARTVTVNFYVLGAYAGTCAVSQAYEEGWIFNAYPTKIPWSGGTYVLQISTNKPVADITVDTPSGITYVSKVQTGYTFSVEPNIALTERNFVLRFHWRNETRLVTLTQEKITFEVDAKDVWGSGGDHLFWVDTNLPFDDIVASLPAGVSAVTLAEDYFNTGYLKWDVDDPYDLKKRFVAFKFPENTGSTEKSYSFSFSYSGITVGTLTVKQPGEHIDHSGDYLTVEMPSGGTLNYIAYDSGGYVEYSVNGGAWERKEAIADMWQTLTNASGSYSVRLRSESPGYEPQLSGNTAYNVYGNILSMVYGDAFIGKTDTTRVNDLVDPTQGWYWIGPRLVRFKGYGKDFSGMVIPLQSVLPQKRQNYSSQVRGMFPTDYVKYSPKIRFAVVYEFGLDDWFNSAPLSALPDIEVSFGAPYAFASMFYSYTPVLSQAPEMPKIHIRRTNGTAFYRMFASSWEISDVVLGISKCAEFLHTISTRMFWNTDNGGRWEMPATFAEMYSGCGALTVTRPLRLVIEDYGRTVSQYSSVFDSVYSGCEALVNVTDLDINCVRQNMFSTAFRGCTSLNSVRVLVANGDGGTYSQNNWMQYVSNSGTIYKRGNFSLPSGVSGVPTGWTVIEI